MSRTIDWRDHGDRFAEAALTEVFREAESAYWLKRARRFDQARPLAGDYLGRLSEHEVRQQDRRIRGKAQACRNRAEVSLIEAPSWLTEILSTEREVA